MVKVIMGLSGTGKTKHLIESINNAIANEAGSMVCIEKGNKLTLGPVTKMLITTSSKDIAKDNSTPDKIAGINCGNTISKKVRNSDAPRSLAASCKEGSMPTKRALTMIKI